MTNGAGTDAERALAEARKAFWVMVTVLAVIWVAQLGNWATGYQLSQDYGMRPRDLGSLPEILSSPFLHFSWEHIEGNSGPLFIFGFLAAYRGVTRFLGLTALVVLTSGLGAWFTEPANTVGAGASGVVFGYFGYIIVRGAFDRHKIDIVIGLVMALCFAYQFSVLLPATAKGISWQAHLFGFIGGIAGGWIFRQRHTSPSRPERTVAAAQPGQSGSAPAQPGQSAPPGSAAALLKELDDLGL